MADPVKKVPLLPLAKRLLSLQSLADFDSNLIPTLIQEFVEHAQRLNLALMKDGTEVMLAPTRLKSVTVAQANADWPAASWEGGLLYVSNEAGGKTVAFSDGINWRRVQDRAILS